jgi:large repetitive protein
VLRLRLQASGSGTTSLNAKVWKTGAVEPAAWQATITDTTAGLQTAGGVGVNAYLSTTATTAPVTATFDKLSVKGIIP